MKKAILFFVFTVVSLFQYAYTQGCSQCKLVSEQATELDESSFGSNINSGIIYLMLIPYFLLLFLFRKKIIGIFRMVFLKK
ncbi:MAG: hypothetical protein KA264_08900 [Crocinitomicaceae bacterium]|jgi:hypothetical protein|nr:hypothetical protein [Crocinitomicaceae bacterium]